MSWKIDKRLKETGSSFDPLLIPGQSDETVSSKLDTRHMSLSEGKLSENLENQIDELNDQLQRALPFESDNGVYDDAGLNWPEDKVRNSAKTSHPKDERPNSPRAATVAPSQHLDRYISLDADTWNDGNEDAWDDEVYMSAYLGIPLPGRPIQAISSPIAGSIKTSVLKSHRAEKPAGDGNVSPIIAPPAQNESTMVPKRQGVVDMHENREQETALSTIPTETKFKSDDIDGLFEKNESERVKKELAMENTRNASEEFFYYLRPPTPTSPLGSQLDPLLALVSSIQSTETEYPLSKATKQSVNDDLTIEELVEGDPGYSTDVDIVYPLGLEEHESEDENDLINSDKDSSDPDILESFKRLTSDGRRQASELTQRKRRQRKREWSTTTQSDGQTAELKAEAADPDVLSGHDIPSSARRLRRRVSGTKDAETSRTGTVIKELAKNKEVEIKISSGFRETMIDDSLSSHGSGCSNGPVFEELDQFADLSILSDPVDYWNRLDDIELRVIDMCLIETGLVDPESNSDGVEQTLSDVFCNTSRAQHICYLDQTLSTIKMLQDEGFVKLDITVLVDDRLPGIVRATTISTADIQEIRDSIHETSQSDATNALAARLLAQITGDDQCDPEVVDRLESVPVVSLLCALLSFALVSYVGSHCSNFDEQIWGSTVDWIALDSDLPHFGLRRRKFACLNEFIGGPVWVFGPREGRINDALLSITMEQFADFWGPLYAIPSGDGFQSLLALQTDGGIMYKTQKIRSFRGETSLHWVSTSPARKDRCQSSLLSFQIFCKQGEQLPAQFEPFPCNGRFIIGQPAAGSTTTTSNCDTDSTYRLSLHTKDVIGFHLNSHCSLDLGHFGQENTFRLHAIGTRKADYVPDELQIGLTAGQYANFGVTKVYKKRPAVNFKTVLLEYCSKPRASPIRVREILQYAVGLEVSACTKNSRRTSLRQALTLAFPNELAQVEDACNSGDPLEVSAFLADLEATGVDESNQLSMFWPLSCGIGEVFKLQDRSEWFTLLKDTPGSACFAVLSDNCMSFVGHDGRNIIKRPCLTPSRPLIDPVLQTTIELNPQGILRPPLKSNAKVNLGLGELQIRNEHSDSQFGYYESSRGFRRFSRRGDVIHRELQNNDRRSPYLMQVCILGRPKGSA